MYVWSNGSWMNVLFPLRRCFVATYVKKYLQIIRLTLAISLGDWGGSVLELVLNIVFNYQEVIRKSSLNQDFYLEVTRKNKFESCFRWRWSTIELGARCPFSCLVLVVVKWCLCIHLGELWHNKNPSSIDCRGARYMRWTFVACAFFS